MKFILSYIFLVIFIPFYSQSDSYENGSDTSLTDNFLKIIYVEQDSTLVNYGKMGSRMDYTTRNITWGVFNRKDSLLYSFDDIDLKNKTVLITNSGQNIVLIKNYIDLSNKHENQVLVEFLVHGEKLKSYKLKDINTFKNKFIESPKGGVWMFNNFHILNDASFVLTTIGMKTMIFDLNSGKITTNTYVDGVNKKSTIIFGEVEKDYSDNASSEMHIVFADKIIQGKNKKQYRFSTSENLNNKYQLVVINDGVYVPISSKTQLYFIK